MTTVLERFEYKWIPEPFSQCWLWTGATDGRGYGTTSFKGRLCKAHRLAYALFVGMIPKGMFVCHKCDTKICVNPKHLFAATQSGNIKDCVSKGRMHFQVNRPTHCKRGHELTVDNSIMSTTRKGQRSCKTCHNAMRRIRRQSTKL